MPTKKKVRSYEDFWRISPLSPDDQVLVDAYVRIAKPLDQLAYTEEFTRLIKMLNLPDTEDQKFLTYQRLLRLRKGGVLPRVGRSDLETY